MEVKTVVNSSENDKVYSFKANKYVSDELYKQGFIVPLGSTIEVRLIKVVFDDGNLSLT